MIFETIVKTVRDDTCAIEKMFEERSSSARRKVGLTSTFRRAPDEFLTNKIPRFFLAAIISNSLNRRDFL
jgi:hypothetical protein